MVGAEEWSTARIPIVVKEAAGKGYGAFASKDLSEGLPTHALQ